MKAKDAYDIYFCLKHFPGGPQQVAKRYAAMFQNELVEDGLQRLREKFASIDAVGPRWAAEVAAESGADVEIAQREAYELTKVLFSPAVPGKRET